MSSSYAESRRGAALVVAVVVILTILAMAVFFLQQSLGHSNRATEDRARAEAMASAEAGLGVSYTRVREGYKLDEPVKEPDTSRTDGGREWSSGWVRGEMDKKDGSTPSSYEVQVWWSTLEAIQGKADSGGTNYLRDTDLSRHERPEEWFKGKKIGISTGELRGLELTITGFDKANGEIQFAEQKWSVEVGDRYEIPSGNEYQFIAEGTHEFVQNPAEPDVPTTRTIETWWWMQNKPLKKYQQRGAVVANGLVEVKGSIEIDGRDHCANGGTGIKEANCPNGVEHDIVDPGVNGVSTTGTVDQGGASTLGGNGDSPVKEPDGLDYAEQGYPANIDDDADNDGQGGTDEDPYNGIDDDRDASGNIVPDGDRDEDTRYPLNPDEALGLPVDTLKDIAKASKTYFSDEGAFLDYFRDHDKVLPGGLVYYLEIPKLSTGKMEMDMSGSDDPGEDPLSLKPIIFIVHYEDASGNPIGEVSNLFIVMKGLFMCDIMEHVNAGTRIIGGVQTFSSDSGNNIFGNGQAKIWYSTAALANLPNDVTNRQFNAQSWREEP